MYLLYIYIYTHTVLANVAAVRGALGAGAARLRLPRPNNDYTITRTKYTSND